MKKARPWIHAVRSYDFGPSATFDSWRLWDTLPKALRASRGEEVIPEPVDDKAACLRNFFTAGLRMPPHAVLTDILVKF
jgi:hypothetical protein